MPNIFPNTPDEKLDKILTEATSEIFKILGLPIPKTAESEGNVGPDDESSETVQIDPLGNATRLLAEIEALAKDDAMDNQPEINSLLEVVDRHLQLIALGR